MSKITAIEVQKRNKGRLNVFVDGEFFCGMEAFSVLKAGLKVGSEVDSQTIQQAIFDSEAEIAFSKSLDYLSRAMKTEKEVFAYLLRKGFSEDVSDFVVQKLRGYKYIDDSTYAHMYINQGVNSKGAIRLKMELKKKGIEKDIVEKALEKVDTKVYNDTVETLAEKFLKNKPRDLKTMQKLQRHLLARGFSFDEVNHAVRKFRETNNDDWH